MHEISWNWVHRRLENATSAKATIRHRPRSALAARARSHSSHRDGTMRGGWKIHGRMTFAKEKQLEMRQPNSAIGKSEPCRQEGWLPQVPVRSHVAEKMQSMQNVQTLFCGLILLMKEKKQCPRSCFPYFFPFHLGSCQSLSNQRVWSGFIPELQADTSGDPSQNPPGFLAGKSSIKMED